MNIIINKDKLKLLKESIDSENISLEDFTREINLFLLNRKTGNPQLKSNFWKLNSLTDRNVTDKLIRAGILLIDDDGNLTDRIPKSNFDRKVSRFYYEMFPEKYVVTEDDGGGGDFGGNTAGSVGGSFEAPFGSIINRKMPYL